MGSDFIFTPSYHISFCFNSRSRMGSDVIWQCAKAHYASFNSRTRMGSDADNPVMICAGAVSIRAPAWGATHPYKHDNIIAYSFNSRSRMGSDCHHAMTGTACIESALFASQAGKVQWCKMQFVCHVFKSISIQYAIFVANTPTFR